jgi:hypothetical protein
MWTPDVEALKSMLVRNNRWMGWCTIAVFVGLLVEYTILLRPKINEFSSRELVFTFIAGVAIAGGVYGEYHFGSIASDAAFRLESVSEERVAQLNKDAEVARLGQEKLRAENLELEKLAVGRQLSPEQVVAVGQSLKPFAGRDLFITSYTGDAEAARLGLQIKAALRRAQINADDNLGRTIPVRGGVAFGVEVTGPENEKKFVDAIANSLRARGALDARSYVITPTMRIDKSVVGILVAVRDLKR